jgi:hypothetical protein
MLSVPQATAMSIVAGVIKHHLFIEGSAFPSFPDERSDYAQDNMSHEDYRDATEGRCGFPWDAEDDDEAVTDNHDKNLLATIAVSMVLALTQTVDEEGYPILGEQNDWVEFLADCFGNEFATEFVMSSWDDEGDTQMGSYSYHRPAEFHLY